VASGGAENSAETMPRNATSFGLFHGSRLKNITTSEAGLVTMTDQPRSTIIEENPIGKGLDVFPHLIRFDL